MRQTPTTLTKDFGSAPTVSSEKSIFSGSAALAQVSNAARPTAAMAIVVVRLLIFILNLHFLFRCASICGGRRVLDQAITISSGRPVKLGKRADDPAIFCRILCICLTQSCSQNNFLAD